MKTIYLSTGDSLVATIYQLHLLTKTITIYFKEESRYGKRNRIGSYKKEY